MAKETITIAITVVARILRRGRFDLPPSMA
jgi:hypothetical protein